MGADNVKRNFGAGPLFHVTDALLQSWATNIRGQIKHAPLALAPLARQREAQAVQIVVCRVGALGAPAGSSKTFKP